MGEDNAKGTTPGGENVPSDAEIFLSGGEPPQPVSAADAEVFLSGGEPREAISAADKEIYLSGGEPGSTPDNEKNPAEESAEPTVPKRRIWHWIVPILLVLLAAVLILHFRAASKSAMAGKGAAGASGGEPQGAAITVGQSKTGDMNIYVDALGTVTPVYTVTLYSQITGRVMNVYYQEGQMVRAGDPLVDIDPRPYQATLTQSQGTLQHDQGVLDQARMDLQRYQAAWDRNAIAKQQLDDQAALVVQYEGTVKTDEGTVAYDRVQLGYCHIVSPISGRVGLRLVDPGNTVFSGTASTLVVITQMQPITVVFNVSEDDLAEIQAQLKGGRQLEVDAFDRSDEKEIEAGKLTSLDNEVDTATGTVKFRAEFPNRNLSLFPNQFVNARLLVKTLRHVTLAPSAAVQHNGANAFVYIVNPNNKVSVQAVTTLASDNQNTAVEGVNPGLNLATSGFDRLENGTQVAVHGAAAATGSSGSASGASGSSGQRRAAPGMSGGRRPANRKSTQATSPAAPRTP